MNENRTIPSLTSLLAATILAAFIVNLLGATNTTPWHVNELAMLVFASVCFVLNGLILRKERPNWHIALLNVSLIVGGFFAIALTNSLPLSVAGFLFSYAVIITVVLSWKLNVSPVSIDTSAILFQAAVAFIVLYIWIGSLTTIVASDLLWLLFMCAFCLIGMLSFRITGSVHSKGLFSLSRIALLLTAFGLLLGTVLLLTVAAEPLGNFFLATFSLFGRILGRIMDIIMLFFEWLNRLFGDPTGYDEPPWKSPYYFVAPEEPAQGNPIGMLIFVAALAAGFAVLAVITIIRILKQKHMPAKKDTQAGQKRTRTSPLIVIKRILMRIREKLELWWVLTIHRDTPVGVYVRLTRVCRLSRYTRHKGETPRTFIMRLASVCRYMNDAETSDALIRLADEVDRLSYSPKNGFGKKMKDANKLYSNTVSLIRRSQLTTRKPVV